MAGHSKKWRFLIDGNLPQARLDSFDMRIYRVERRLELSGA